MPLLATTKSNRDMTIANMTFILLVFTNMPLKNACEYVKGFVRTSAICVLRLFFLIYIVGICMVLVALHVTSTLDMDVANNVFWSQRL